MKNLRLIAAALVLAAVPCFAQPTPLTSTLADLTCPKLEAYYAPPAPLTSFAPGSTDPAVFVQDPNYIKQQNRQNYHRYAVDVPNKWIGDRFDFTCKQWESAKPKSVFLPAPPKYLVFDENAFESWWALVLATKDIQSQTFGDDAPPLFFVKPAQLPPDLVILGANSTAPAAPATDGPIGAAVPNNPGVFNSAGDADKFPDGYIYAGPTGIYQKHIYNNPFTAGQTRVIWIALQLTK